MKIAPKSTFDECFQTFPRLRAPAKLTDFWQKALEELKKTPVDAHQKLMVTKSLGRESMMEVDFQSFGGERIKGLLSIPRKRGKVPVIVSFHDYLEKPETFKDFSDQGMAHLAIELRRHSILEEDRKDAEGRPLRPAFFHSFGFNKVESSYPFACFLDAVRAVDFTRLQKGIDPKRIGVLGRGFGASMAVFTAAMRKDIKAIALERGSFIWMEGWLQEAGSQAAEEARAILTGSSQSVRTRLRKNLDFLDVLNWAEVITQPVQVSVALKDEINPPRSSFAFFNHLQTEKDMDLFPEEMDESHNLQQRKKSVRFLAEILNK